MLTPLELFKREQKYWKKKNTQMLGLTAIDEKQNFEDLQLSIDADCKKYWNGKAKCLVAKKLDDGTLDRDYDKRKKDSYSLKLNPLSMCVDVYADYQIRDEYVALKVCSIPTPLKSIQWMINNAKYTPRIAAIRDNNTFITKSAKDNNIILGEYWVYNIQKKEFTCVDKFNAFDVSDKEIIDNHLSKRSKAFLEALINETLTTSNLHKAMKSVPVVPNNSVYNYAFYRFEYYEDVITSGRRYAQPTKGRLLGISSLFTTQKPASKYPKQLVLTDTNMFALDTFRTSINVFKPKNSSFTPTFTYADTTQFLDSFKTSTSGAAGRQRLLLDDIVVHGGMLFVVDKFGSETCMYEYYGKENKDRDVISCISFAPFCFSDQPKRIMMNGKMSSQAVQLHGENDNVSHRIKARVCFADIEGFTYADSIVVSESFAKRLRTYDSAIITLLTNSRDFKRLKKKFDEGTFDLDLQDLRRVFPNKNDAILLSYEDVKVVKLDYVDDSIVRVFIEWSIPFRVGDKISNLHGAKGVVSKIIPDDEMPKLKNKAGNMPAGPLEVVISGFSTVRRGSLGQLFEAWMTACELDIPINEQYIPTVAKKYKKELKKFSDESVVEYKGDEVIKPVGIIDIIRLYHYAATHTSEASKYASGSSTLKFGEMEQINLAANGADNVLNELAIRSKQRYSNSVRLITEMENTRQIPTSIQTDSRFAKLLKSFGYDFVIDGQQAVKSDTINALAPEDYENLNSWEELE